MAKVIVGELGVQEKPEGKNWHLVSFWVQAPGGIEEIRETFKDWPLCLKSFSDDKRAEAGLKPDSGEIL